MTFEIITYNNIHNSQITLRTYAQTRAYVCLSTRNQYSYSSPYKHNTMSCILVLSSAVLFLHSFFQHLEAQSCNLEL